jgi:hypothetical protein
MTPEEMLSRLGGDPTRSKPLIGRKNVTGLFWSRFPIGAFNPTALSEKLGMEGALAVKDDRVHFTFELPTATAIVDGKGGEDNYIRDASVWFIPRQPKVGET